MAGKRTLDGSSAAYDMRSLGKHIEAVSIEHPASPCLLCFELRYFLGIVVR